MLAVEVENVVKQFPGGWRKPPVRIIDNVSFTVEKGQHVAIIGPNGCGKTTLLRTIATIYRPDAGKVRIFGQDVFSWRQSERSRRAFAFISPALNFQAKLTLRQTIEFFATVLQKPPETVVPFLKRTGLYTMWDRRLEGFSEGQKAMLRLAIAFLKQPRVLFLDEVVANLDLARREKVIGMLEEMEAFQDLTLLMVDHDPFVVDRLCERILVLKEGGKVHKFTSVHELMDEVPYRFTVEVNLKRDIDDKLAEKVAQPLQRYEMTLRYFAPDEQAVHKISRRVLKLLGERVQDYVTAPVSLKDVYYLMREES
ncbi:MAG: ABC transporter ATP-binding protein [Candidatus Poseidoniia archaeon]|jgi:putative ABC transport system ATP-binding protein|nr:ABC transporter ATP-binding protein [Candidatus Poseidoniia archaeon]MDP6533842.1 ABC transporter ATP-binding protein [Candidatus Poseidoniia archaeon]MDP6835087.1 ABC transporter ATP-binding protein [Candidatus Poseidoniia archaeon]|tara:strand:+ start:146 stop:1078 length:933 start_codon:yes stop_codon:yes gene_type:complete